MHLSVDAATLQTEFIDALDGILRPRVAAYFCTILSNKAKFV